jgi:polar amino acid transport system substrate-binding protein
VPIEFASGYSPSLEEYGYARYGIRKDDIDLNHAISRAIDELRAKRDGIPRILEEGGLGLRNMWYFPVTAAVAK